MWRDCSDFLKQALERFPREDFFQEKETEDIAREFAQAIADPSLQRPRPPVLADLGSAIGFAIGKAYLAAGGPGPEAFAKMLLESAHASESAQFRFAVERGGYINVDFPEAGKNAFFEKLLGMDFKEILTPDLNFSWEEVERRLLQVQDEYLQEFLRLPPERKTSSEFRLMTLGVLSDPELDLEPFLRGLKGKQNLPWAFSRFEFDLSECETLTASPGEDAENGLLQDFLRANRDRLLWLRWSWEKSCKEEKPEQFFSFLLALLHLNYSFLNRPDFRLALSRQLPSVERETMVRVLQFLRKLFAESAARLTR